MWKRKSLFFLLLSLLLPACAPMQPAAVSTVLPVVMRLVTSAPNPTPTRTPFRPLPITPTPMPGQVSTVSGTPYPTIGPRPTDGPPTPTPWYLNQPFSPDRKNILVLGSDLRPSGGYRTDVIMLVSIDPVRGKAAVVSFPRDLFVIIPGYGSERINVVMGMGGFSLLADTMQNNFGVRPDYYMMVNFERFVAIINALGGIDVEVEKPLTDHCDLYWSRAGICTVESGKVNMDGNAALWYVRSRYSSNDFDRTRREQEVLKAIFQKLMSQEAVVRAPELFGDFRGSVETNMEILDMLSLVRAAPQVAQDGGVRRLYIGPEHVWNYVVPETGAMVLMPNNQAIAELVRSALEY